MGACATKPKVLKEGETPEPVKEEVVVATGGGDEVVDKGVAVEEEEKKVVNVEKDTGAVGADNKVEAEIVDDSSKRRSLSNLFKENEAGKEPAESDKAPAEPEKSETSENDFEIDTTQQSSGIRLRRGGYQLASTFAGSFVSLFLLFSHISIFLFLLGLINTSKPKTSASLPGNSEQRSPSTPMLPCGTGNTEGYPFKNGERQGPSIPMLLAPLLRSLLSSHTLAIHLLLHNFLLPSLLKLCSNRLDMACKIKTWYAILVLLKLVSQLQDCAHAAPQVPCFFIFGDSLADNGNNNHLATDAKANYPPFGIDFLNQTSTGRFTNGRTTVDVIGPAFPTLLNYS
ncbi:hypothetical protein D5086_002717 [Populus alba]|uniref:Uncharacterized protein n=1 Tax=Populus alba TaxID=43335 RepID=A0ACC4D464_POPAL